MKTYLAYCRRAIEFFRPDYLCIGIEVNEIHRDGGEQKWNAYAALHRHVYGELKKEHKDLPIFASFTLHSTFQKRGSMLDSFKKLMPYNDLVAVSYYPFFVPEKDRLTALDWMTEQFDAFQKPYAVVETNDSAERLPLPQLKAVLEGTPEKQADYYGKLLGLAQKRQFAFVISFVHQDYDALWQKIESSSPELFKAWRDSGLVDENGKPRPALQVWKDFFALPLAGH
jgi:arabinogalactan endo-1,4-beta-galactosidase